MTSAWPIYDAHNHLHDARLLPYRVQVLDRLTQIGVKRFVVNGTDPGDWEAVLQLAEEDERVIPSLGVHPWKVKAAPDNYLDTLQTKLRRRRCGIGEIGLDRWMDNPDVQLQERVFVEQLRLAAEENLPLSIHCLKSWGRLLALLEHERKPACGFLLHSYAGPGEMVQRFVELGAYFSFSGYFAHERKARQREVFSKIPIDRLLLETDAPDMLPPEALNRFPLANGQGTALNNPANIVAVYEYFAAEFGHSIEEFSPRIESNFLRLFGGICQVG